MHTREVPHPRDRFTAVADVYARFRPSYPDGVLDWIARTSGAAAGARVVDLGCGTGIFSRLLAARGYAVTGVDVNQGMLAHASAAGGGPAYVHAEAHRTGLPAGSADLVTAAQAFHWFPIPEALAEIDRLLAPGGWACALWNVRTPGGFNDEYEALLHAHSREYIENPALDDLHNDPRADLVAAVPGALTASVPGGDRIDRDTALGRIRSASYVRHGIADLPAFEAQVGEAFDRRADPAGILDWRMNALLIAWPRRA